MTGFEPATSRSTIWCSNQLSYTHRVEPKTGLTERPELSLSYTLRPNPSTVGLRDSDRIRLDLSEFRACWTPTLPWTRSVPQSTCSAPMGVKTTTLHPEMSISSISGQLYFCLPEDLRHEDSGKAAQG